MKIKEIQVKNFKRFDDLLIRGVEKAKLVILIGENGSGKSSLLEVCNAWHRNTYLNDYPGGEGFWEWGYYRKDPKEESQIDIKFDRDIEGLDRNKLMHFRSAHRHESDFKIKTFRQTEESDMRSKISRMIDSDVSVSENFQILVATSIKGLYNEQKSDLKVAELREELIGKIQKSINNIFNDLSLNGLEDLFKEGTFYFKKGKVKSFNYKNLSSGEKSAFDLLLDLILRIEYFDDSVIFIDEIETHIHTALQAKLVEEIYKLIPEQNQLWITTHSLGVLQKARELTANQKEDIVVLDFSDSNFDEPVVLEPKRIDGAVWKKFLSLTLDGMSSFIAPEVIIFCEGSLEGNARKNFDADIYNKIFEKKYPDAVFISGGNCNDLKKFEHMGVLLLETILKKTKILKLIDLDSQSDEEVEKNNKKGILVLKRRDLETYLLDDEILKKFCIDQNLSDIEGIFKEVKELRCKHKSEPKKARGEIYNLFRKKLQEEGKNYRIGSNADEFLKTYLYQYVTEDTLIYQELESIIFGNFKNRDNSK